MHGFFSKLEKQITAGDYICNKEAAIAKTIVIYWSRYGATKQYATWIADSLGADLIDHKQIRKTKFDQYETIVLGSPVYYDRILGIRHIDRFLRRQKSGQNIVTFIVQLVTTKNFDYSGRIVNENIGPEFGSQSRLFYLRGALDWSRISRWHAFTVNFLSRRVPSRVFDTRAGYENDTARLFVDKNNVNYVDKASIEPIVDYVNHVTK